MLRSLGLLALAAALTLGAGASEASAEGADNVVTITALLNNTGQPAMDVTIANFERVYPNIKVDATYADITVLTQLELTELAAGNAADLLHVSVGCQAGASVCTLAKAGYLAPLVNEPWAKRSRSLPLVTSASKYGRVLYAFDPGVAPEGLFENDDLFKKLELSVPQTFSQFLHLCRAAKAAGTVALQLAGASQPTMSYLIQALAVPTVYGKDPHWGAELKAGKTSFDATPGWHQALQEVIEMNDAGCFEPGAAGTTSAAAQAEFAQGQGLMMPGVTSQLGQINALNPQFEVSAYPFPGGTDPNQPRTFLALNTAFGALGINAHSSVQNQAAAHTFIDFIARPKQDALFEQISGGLTQYEFLKGQIPAGMSAYANVFKENRYTVSSTLGTAAGNTALLQDAVGLLTGQSTIDDVLNAMDEAWKQRPA